MVNNVKRSAAVVHRGAVQNRIWLLFATKELTIDWLLLSLYPTVSAMHKHKMHSSSPNICNSDMMKYIKQDMLIILLTLIVQHGCAGEDLFNPEICIVADYLGSLLTLCRIRSIRSVSKCAAIREPKLK